jgi:hypothetical protein
MSIQTELRVIKFHTLFIFISFLKCGWFFTELVGARLASPLRRNTWIPIFIGMTILLNKGKASLAPTD